MKWYFTFGFGQGHDNGYHIVESETEEEARDIMTDRFGLKWGMQYRSPEEAGIEKFNLHLVERNYL